MKNLVLKFMRLKLVVFGFILTGFTVLSFSELQAQTFTSHNGGPQGAFVDVYTAIDRLEAELASIKFLLSNLHPNSQAYRELNAKYLFYDKIREILADSKTFDSARVALVVKEVGSFLHSDAYGGLSKTLILQLKQDVTLLLQ